MKARVEEDMSKYRHWGNLKQETGEAPPNWIPNSGFLIFKNYAHQEIREKWIRYSKEINFTYSGSKQIDQVALALAASGLEKEKMREKEHVMEWREEKIPDGYVYHLCYPNNISL